MPSNRRIKMPCSYEKTTRPIRARTCTHASAADLGHFQLSQTQRYTHVSLELTQHAADRMEEALWG
ncbi:MAG: hypothetical protein QOJ73_890 [Streptosporangiaceae bacterium]|nr:hypothetical protein [Streptosporangiaceae bacterium]